MTSTVSLPRLDPREKMRDLDSSRWIARALGGLMGLAKCAVLTGVLVLLPVGLADTPALSRQIATEAALPWLADGGQSSSETPMLCILRLDCSSCLDRLEAVLNGKSGLSLLYFDYSRTEERRVAQLLIASALSAGKAADQAVAFRYALKIYLQSPGEHLAHPEKYAALIEPLLASSTARNQALAQALNRLDQQQMIMGLLGVARTPVEVPLSQPALVLPNAKSAQDSLIPLRDRRVSLACLQPKSRLDETGRILRVALSPEQRLPAAVWRQLALQLPSGLAWHWLTEEGDRLPAAFSAWHGHVLTLPDDAARFSSFQEVINKLANSSGPDLSFVEALSPVKDAPSIAVKTGALQLDWILRIMRLNEALTPSQ